MFNFPKFFYVKAFWEGVSYALAGVLLILNVFGLVDQTWVISGGAILTTILGFLRFLKVEPTLRAMAAVAEQKKPKAKAK